MNFFLKKARALLQPGQGAFICYSQLSDCQETTPPQTNSVCFTAADLGLGVPSIFF